MSEKGRRSWNQPRFLCWLMVLTFGLSFLSIMKHWYPEKPQPQESNYVAPTIALREQGQKEISRILQAADFSSESYNLAAFRDHLVEAQYWFLRTELPTTWINEFIHNGQEKFVKKGGVAPLPKDAQQWSAMYASVDKEVNLRFKAEGWEPYQDNHWAFVWYLGLLIMAGGIFVPFAGAIYAVKIADQGRSPALEILVAPGQFARACFAWPFFLGSYPDTVATEQLRHAILDGHRNRWANGMKTHFEQVKHHYFPVEDYRDDVDSFVLRRLSRAQTVVSVLKLLWRIPEVRSSKACFAQARGAIYSSLGVILMLGLFAPRPAYAGDSVLLFADQELGKNKKPWCMLKFSHGLGDGDNFIYLALSGKPGEIFQADGGYYFGFGTKEKVGDTSWKPGLRFDFNGKVELKKVRFEAPGSCGDLSWLTFLRTDMNGSLDFCFNPIVTLSPKGWGMEAEFQWKEGQEPTARVGPGFDFPIKDAAIHLSLMPGVLNASDTVFRAWAWIPLS